MNECALPVCAASAASLSVAFGFAYLMLSMMDMEKRTGPCGTMEICERK